jgi:hypothetical protein
MIEARLLMCGCHRRCLIGVLKKQSLHSQIDVH